MAATVTLQPMPPFVNDDFVLSVLLSMGGKATLMQMKEHVKAHYSGWTKNALMYFGTQVNALVKSGYLQTAKIDFRHGETKPIFYITDEAMAIIKRSR